MAPSSLQTAGDCQKIVCDGNGGDTSVNDATDLPTSNSACLIDPACTGNPLAPSFTPAPETTTCTASDPKAHVCGDPSNSTIAGTCVECNTSADCAAESDGGPGFCTATFTCE